MNLLCKINGLTHPNDKKVIGMNIFHDAQEIPDRKIFLSRLRVMKSLMMWAIENSLLRSTCSIQQLYKYIYIYIYIYIHTCVYIHILKSKNQEWLYLFIYLSKRGKNLLKKLMERHQRDRKKCLNPDSNRDPPAYVADCSTVELLRRTRS